MARYVQTFRRVVLNAGDEKENRNMNTRPLSEDNQFLLWRTLHHCDCHSCVYFNGAGKICFGTIIKNQLYEIPNSGKLICKSIKLKDGQTYKPAKK